MVFECTMNSECKYCKLIISDNEVDVFICTGCGAFAHLGCMDSKKPSRLEGLYYSLYDFMHSQTFGFLEVTVTKYTFCQNLCMFFKGLKFMRVFKYCAKLHELFDK